MHSPMCKALYWRDGIWNINTSKGFRKMRCVDPERCLTVQKNR